MTQLAVTSTEVEVADGAPNGAVPLSRARRLAGQVWFWTRRYLPAELVGTATLFLASWVAGALGAGVVVIAYAAVIGESLGFYAVLGVAVFREQQRLAPALGGLTLLRRTVLLLLAECGPAELLDSLLMRPLVLVLSMYLLPDGWDLLVGKIIADVVFYLTAGLCYTLTVRLRLRGVRGVEEGDTP